MKKNLRKLSLSRETLHTLAALPAVKAAGPGTVVVPPDTIYDTRCDYTMSCTCPGACTFA